MTTPTRVRRSIYPRLQSATERRQLRSQIRNVLGTSRDSAPSALAALRATMLLDRLVRLTTNGEFALFVGRSTVAGTEYLSPSEVHSEAIERGVEH